MSVITNVPVLQSVFSIYIYTYIYKLGFACMMHNSLKVNYCHHTCLFTIIRGALSAWIRWIPPENCLVMCMCTLSVCIIQHLRIYLICPQISTIIILHCSHLVPFKLAAAMESFALLTPIWKKCVILENICETFSLSLFFLHIVMNNITISQ